MQNMKNEMNGNIQSMGINMENRMDVNMQMLKAGQEEMKAELVKVKGEMQTMNRKMADETSTPRGEMTESRGSVGAVWTAMETGKVEVTSDATIVKGETGKLGQGMTEIIKETQQSKEGDGLHETKEEHTHKYNW